MSAHATRVLPTTVDQAAGALCRLRAPAAGALEGSIRPLALRSFQHSQGLIHACRWVGARTGGLIGAGESGPPPEPDGQLFASGVRNAGGECVQQVVDALYVESIVLQPRWSQRRPFAALGFTALPVAGP